MVWMAKSPMVNSAGRGRQAIARRNKRDDGHHELRRDHQAAIARWRLADGPDDVIGDLRADGLYRGIDVAHRGGEYGDAGEGNNGRPAGCQCERKPARVGIGSDVRAARCQQCQIG